MAVDKGNAGAEENSAFLRFCKIVLGWDYFSLLKESKEKQKEERSNGSGDGSGLREVKNTYKDVDDYLSTFEPLLFEEVKAQIIQRNEEGTDWISLMVKERNEVDGFVLPDFVSLDEEMEISAEVTRNVSINDLLLVSREKIEMGGALPTTYAFALVEHHKDASLRLRMHLVGEVVNLLNTDIVETRTRLLNMRSLITSAAAGQKLWCLKICSLSTTSREYIALRSIASLPFKDVILKASDKSNDHEDQAWTISGALHEHFEGSLNKSQLAAIDAGLSRKPFVLIQGPPGTGKTQTILALLSAILHATPARVQNKGGMQEIIHGPELSIEEKCKHWVRASPWLIGINPRDMIMPVDGDDGEFPTTGNYLKPEVVVSRRRYRVRVLVCAPSNSALDEIVFRLLGSGVRDENVQTYNPKIVRIGLNAHHSIQSVSMDHLVNQKKRESGAGKQKQGAAGQDMDSFRAAVMDEAVIVFSTLSFSGSSHFSKANHHFDVVIIDEAAQAVEPAVLVPLATGCKQVFLVGDPKQLPATVISPVAEKFRYGKSLFQRFQEAGYPVNMLNMQYRMHPKISSFPSKEFYNQELKDGEDMDSKTTRAWHQYRCFGPFCFFDLHEGLESQADGSGSWENIDEVDFVLLMYNELVTMNPDLRSSSHVAIISPYRSQVKKFRERFQATYNQDSETFVDIQTVDGFQGREKDVVLFSCVRASKGGSIGFVSDERRMNVGITRAKSTVLVVGSASTLRRDDRWRNLIESAENDNVLFKVSKPYESFFSDANLQMMKDGVAGQLPHEHDQGDGDYEAMEYNMGDGDDDDNDEPFQDGEGDEE